MSGVELRLVDGVYHLFIKQGEQWLDVMNDTPFEVALNMDIGKQAYGKVLVGGLGFGLIHRALLENPNVTSVTSVDVNPEVEDIAKQISPSVDNAKHDIVIDDFFHFCETTKQKFDFVFEDICPYGSVSACTFHKKILRAVKPILKVGGRLVTYYEYCRPYYNHKISTIEGLRKYNEGIDEFTKQSVVECPDE